ncbi:hypothetical protein E2C01_095757 [Portunus trituberculatus]|uniref:Uncharacterized protein n=1 Tax=Portunus trituberculatus TaxID=210409 RepID=A0A5B7K084_PORTR|nr:hypothetical protein [Portunus trituberculatus]
MYSVQPRHQRGGRVEELGVAGMKLQDITGSMCVYEETGSPAQEAGWV